MDEDHYEKWSNNKPSSRPNSHAKTVLKEIYVQILQLEYVRRERLMLARPTAGIF